MIARRVNEARSRVLASSKYVHHYSRTPEPTPKDLVLLLSDWAAQTPQSLTLSKLLSFGRPLTSESILASASYVLNELPKRLAQRVKALDSLPFIVGTNPFIARTNALHKSSFRTLAMYHPVERLSDNWDLISRLEELVQGHAHDIPTMAKGFQECARYMSPDDISTFLDGAIRSRIGIRLIAEQHVAISRAFRTSPLGEDHIGIMNMACSPAEMIRTCAEFVAELCEGTLGSSPSFHIDGKTDATFSYVPVHVEYILTELLKNSFRATVEHHHKLYGQSSSVPLPQVLVTISPSSQLGTRPAFLNIRIRDQGGGISPTNFPRVFSYAFTTAGRDREDEPPDSREPEDKIKESTYDLQDAVEDETSNGAGNLFEEITGKGLQTGLGTIAGLGYGLPLANLYARYFGGSLELRSLYGHGTDVFVKLRCLDQGGEVEI